MSGLEDGQNLPGCARRTVGVDVPTFCLLAFSMSNEELIRRFEGDLVPEDSFHHADHVRLAFAYLSHYPPLQALEKFSAALKRFATGRGKSQLYHETITHAYFFLIRERMARASAAEWDEFSRHNQDLLSRYYQPATLQSVLARTVFLFPDKFR